MVAHARRTRNGNRAARRRSTRPRRCSARVAGRAYDANNNEICASELDPDAVLDVALAHLVTPMTGANGQPTETPLEVIIDVIADVNRAAPGTDDEARRDGLRQHGQRAVASSCSTRSAASSSSTQIVAGTGPSTDGTTRRLRPRRCPLAGLAAHAGDRRPTRGRRASTSRTAACGRSGAAGAFVAGADDLGAIWYNPAGIVDAPSSLLLDASWLHYTSDFTRQALTTSSTGTSFVQTFPKVSGSTPVLPIPTIAGSYRFGDREQYAVAGGVYAPMTPVTSYPVTVSNPTARRAPRRSATRSSRSTARRSS